MDKYRFLLFDLDGTVTDSGPGIMNAAQIALSRYNIEEADSERLRLFVGPPLDKSFMERYGFSEEQAWEAIGYFREYYNKTGIFENSVYPGMDNLLKELKEAGYVLAIASSKPIVLIHRVLGHFDIDKYFDVVVGCELDGTRSKKSEVIEEVIKQLSELALERGLPEVKELSIMIGDRCYDVEGAHSFGMPCVGVLYGYGSREEMEEAGADYITETVETLGELFL
ncbi:HAD hydrolase-like protein [Butyrivibrio sp. AE2032]|uniref:HAD hydrolase-like protein n=1 Tax=Butyrivibrio sp. AE2032 TaxID=1458463 RepID=UPI0005566A4A|nr:HAD hydrolase-like protein [Butyrivibrio sp. AE2032]